MRPSSTLPLMLVLRGQTLHASAYLNSQLLDDSLVEVDIVEVAGGAPLVDPVRVVLQPNLGTATRSISTRVPAVGAALKRAKHLR